EIKVEDLNGNPVYYDLSDTLMFGAGTIINNIEVSYTGTDGLQTAILNPNPADTVFQIVTNERIREQQTDIYRIHVVFSVDPEVATAESSDCDYTNDNGNNSGLSNVAVIDDGKTIERDTACVELPMPGVRLTKTIISEPRPIGNKNEFSITYAITVEDTTGYRAYYDLSDTIQLGHGADFVSASVT